MTIEIKEVQNFKDLKKFALFPYSLYKNNMHWVPPVIKNEIETLRSDKNPAFNYCEAKYWLAYKDTKLVGRIASIINHKYIEKWKNNYAFFSRLDFVDDEEVSKTLLQKAESWAKSKGMEGNLGPMGYTNFDHQGMLVKGFEELPTTASTYNFDYYPEHLEKFGYRKKIDYLEFEVKVPDEIPEKAVRISNIVLKKHKLKLLKVNSKKELLPYARQIFDVINITYRHLFSFVELTDKQIEIYTKKYFPYLSPEYVTIVLDENDKVIGFQITMPSLSRAMQKAKGRLFPFGFIHILNALKKPKYLDLYLVGILPEYQNKGINAIFMTELNKIALEKNILSAETNSEMEENKKVQDFWKYYESRQHKRKRIYLKVF